jgi:hypothetical protein
MADNNNGTQQGLFELPKFPTAFTTEDKKRMSELEQQRREMEKVYQAKFSKKAWEATSPAEKFVRSALPSQLSGVAEFVTPWEVGAWDFGFTPEQFQENVMEVEEEYKELARRSKVTSVLPEIQSDIILSALEGSPILDRSQLMSTFPELRFNFNEEEIDYLSRLSEAVLHADPEDILTGEVFAHVTEQDLEELLRTTSQDPRFILSTVAFSKNLSEIREALQQAYPPDVKQDELSSRIREGLLSYFKDRSIALGITEEGELTQDSIQKIHEELARTTGESIVLYDDSSGSMVSATKREDNTVWVGDRLMGKVTEAGIVPMSIFDGRPLESDEDRESDLKNVWDAFYKALNQAWYGVRSGILNVIPQAFESTAARLEEKTHLEESIFGKEAAEGWKQSRKETIEALQRNQEARTIEFETWLEQHPELKDKPEYTQSPVEHPELLTDPWYYAHVIASSAPIIGVALGTGIIVGATTGNPMAGALAGAAVITPVEVSGVYDDLIESGADPDNASMLATSVGTLIGAVEVIPGLIELKAISPMFMKMFRKNLQKEITNQVVKRLSARGILSTATKIEVSEVLEEVVQESMQNAAVKTVDDNRSLVENIPDVAIEAAIATLPLAALGGGGEYVGMRRNLPPDVQEEMDTTKAKMTEAGLSEEHAEAVAFSKVIETETGQVQVEEAKEKAQDSEPVSTRITKLEERVAGYNDEIADLEGILEKQRKNLADMEKQGSLPSKILEQRSIIKDFEEELEMSKKNRDAAVKKLNKVMKSPNILEPVVGDWDSLSREARERLAQEAGIAKTSAKLNWDELNEVQREKVRSFRESMPHQDSLEIQARNLGIAIGEATKQTPLSESPQVLEPGFEYIVPYRESDPITPVRRPRVMDWTDERDGVQEALGNRKISEGVKNPDKINTLNEVMSNTINKLQDRYRQAKRDDNKEEIEEIEKELKGLAKAAGIRQQDILGKNWEDIDPDSKIALAISAIPDRSIKFSGMREFFDMEYFMQFLEEMTGAPFYSMLRRVEAANASAETAKEQVLKAITVDPDLKGVRTDESSLGRVSQELNARNEVQGVEHPDNLSENEMLMADTIEAIYNSYKPVVRYLRFMRVVPEIEELKREFPDAVEAGKEQELKIALEIRNRGNLDDLWNYLYKLDWGVIQHGFDPRLIAAPGLRIVKSRGLRTKRGEGRLLRREAIEYPEGKMSMNVLARLAAYIEQMEIQWRIEPELDTLAGYWNMVGNKFQNWGTIEKGLETWLERVQNIGLGYKWYDRLVRRVWRQAMAAVFIEPYMSLRNSFQSILFHPDRTELVKSLVRKLPKGLSEKANIYFDTFTSQLGGLRKDWLHVGEKGFLVPDWWNRLADALNLYGRSDYYPRLWSFKASLGKAKRATDNFIKDGNVKRWLKDSGAIHLRQTEQNYVLSHYLGQLNKTFDLGIRGLRELSGADMANFYIAQRIADMTHFKYRRSSRGIIEMGNSGTTLWNLIVFPRGYAQRLYFQAEKIKKALSGDATWLEAKGSFDDIMGLAVAGIMFGQLFYLITGRKRNPYDPMNILFGWTFGGLFVGIAIDITSVVAHTAQALWPLTDDETRDIALSSIPQELERNFDTLVPFYRRTLDIIEASVGKEHLDRNLFRKLRALVDDKYTPEELEELDMSTWEKIRKAILGGQVPDPTKLEDAMRSAEEAEAKLGAREMGGEYYTLTDYAGVMGQISKTIPDILITEQEGWSPLALFYKECEAHWVELEKTPSRDRDEWRKNHVLEEAMLLFWGRYNKSVFARNSEEGEEVVELLDTWFDIYDIDMYKHKHWADWKLPMKPLTEE